MMEKPKITFAPGCFDGFDGTPEELAEVLADLHRMAEDGTLLENAQPVDEEDEEFFKYMMSKIPTRQ